MIYVSDSIKHFLLVYDRDEDVQLSAEEFDDGAEAVAAYTAIERKIRKGTRRIEAVLVGGESLEAVKVTHSTWFTGGSKRLIEQFLSLAP